MYFILATLSFVHNRMQDQKEDFLPFCKLLVMRTLKDEWYLDIKACRPVLRTLPIESTNSMVITLAHTLQKQLYHV